MSAKGCIVELQNGRGHSYTLDFKYKHLLIQDILLTNRVSKILL